MAAKEESPTQGERSKRKKEKHTHERKTVEAVQFLRS